MVDDRPANLIALEAILEPLDVPLVRALSGEEALLQLLQGDFAVILLDVQMPGLNGLETAELIKKRERCRHIPIILITAISREAAYVFKGYTHGAVDYLLKPVDPDILRAKVAVFLDLYRRGETIRQQATLLGQSEAKEAFLAVVAHELRTPLTAAKAQAQLALRQMPPDEEGAARRALNVISRQIDRLVKLVGELLDLNALEGGRLALRPTEFDFGTLLGEVVERTRALSAEHTMHFDLQPGMLITADRDRIEQVVVNLLSNAVRYSPDGGRIDIELHAEGESLRLSVADQGLGIERDKQEMIFERFGRAHGTAYGGLGLGLYITKGIVEQHGGRIWVESGRGTGSTFFVELPARGHKA